MLTPLLESSRKSKSWFKLSLLTDEMLKEKMNTLKGALIDLILVLLPPQIKEKRVVEREREEKARPCVVKMMSEENS